MIAPSSADFTLPQLVLIVDADEDTRELYKMFLVPRRYVVETAADGRTALAKAICDVPDVIVTDLHLAGIDGFTLCALLRAERSTKEVPIVVLTAESRFPQLERARQAGADKVLTKPCLPERLLAEMQQIREHSRALRARSSIARDLAKSRVAAAIDLRTRSVNHTMWTTHERSAAPPLVDAPPAVRCPRCHAPLAFRPNAAVIMARESAEVWEMCECPDGCGPLLYCRGTGQFRSAIAD